MWVALCLAGCHSEPVVPPEAPQSEVRRLLTEEVSSTPSLPETLSEREEDTSVLLAPEPEPRGTPYPGVKLGIDVLLDDEVDLVRGKRVGLITNASGVDGHLVATTDRLHRDKRVKLVKLFAPEHGIRGAIPAGVGVEDRVDARTGVPVVSLFGDTHKPSSESLVDVEVLVFDIQDIGSRTYTYVTTMGKSMEAAADAGIPFVVLDRPNPLGVERFEGPVRLDKYKSFVGYGPTTVSHGMTVGELARFFNTEMKIGCELHVVKMDGYSREMMWADTGRTFIPTSPNIPHLLNAQLYIATGMIGGVSRNVNEGYGTTMPFETIAAAFIEPETLSEALNDVGLEGVRFRPITYRPTHGRFRKKIVHGVQLLLDDPKVFRPLRTALTILVTLQTLYPGQTEFRGNFGRIWGNKEVLKRLRAGEGVSAIEASWEEERQAFGEKRARYVLY